MARQVGGQVKTLYPMTILYPGRFQPFHAGHKAVVEKLLDGGAESVAILVRDTPINAKNPYTLNQRIAMIRSAFANEKRVMVQTVADFEYIAQGRSPGWRTLPVNTDAYLEALSATKLRDGHIIWIFGQSGSGKTTLAQALKRQLPSAINLDGDQMRDTISVGAGFSEAERLDHNKRVARLAALLRDQGHTVIVSLITPTPGIRQSVEHICEPFWIYLTRNEDFGDPQYIFEKPSVGELDHGRADRFMQVDNKDREAERTAELAWPYVLSYIT